MPVAAVRIFVLCSICSLVLVACGGDGDGATGPSVDVGTTNSDIATGDIEDNADTSGGDQDAGGDDAGNTTPDSGEADGGDDAGIATDTGSDAGGSPDAGPTTCPGTDGCACTINSECTSGVCMTTHEGKRCAQKCTETCPDSYSCQNIGDGSPLFYCVSTQLTLCSPCKFHSDCQVNGVASLCVDYGADGKFCGAPCSADSECPTDYSCATVKDSGGKDVKQCKRKEVAGKPMLCECSDWAKKKGLETSCVNKNEFGSCKSSRKCDSKGLTKCEAKTPASEVCNGVDDNCDGTTDNLPKDFSCTIKAFESGGSKTACAADGDCKTTGEACDTATKTCRVLIGACPGKAACSDKGALICTGTAAPKVETCNGTDDDCDGKTDEDFMWTGGGGGKLAVGSACGVGACAGGKVVCDGAAASVCTGLSKATTETCDGVDNDCDGSTDDAACDDNDACTKDVCDATAKSCSNPISVDCDDKDACTTDTCDKVSAKCGNTPYTGSCDDGNACSLGDVCGKDVNSGKYTCLAGKSAQKCDDNNPCTDDICDTQAGCQNKPNSGSQPCYTGSKGTKGEGECKAGKSFCKNGQLQGKCTGETTPTSKELCDGKDRTCNGVKDEGCAPKAVKVTFANAHINGKSGKMNVDMLVGQIGISGQTANAKHSLRFGFLAWLQSFAK